MGSLFWHASVVHLALRSSACCSVLIISTQCLPRRNAGFLVAFSLCEQGHPRSCTGSTHGPLISEIVCPSGENTSASQTHTEPMTVTELTLDQLQHIAGASSFTSNPVAAQEDMFASGRLLTPNELKIYVRRIMLKRSQRLGGYQPKYSL